MNICFADYFHNCAYSYCDHKIDTEPNPKRITLEDDYNKDNKIDIYIGFDSYKILDCHYCRKHQQFNIHIHVIDRNSKAYCCKYIKVHYNTDNTDNIYAVFWCNKHNNFYITDYQHHSQS